MSRRRLAEAIVLVGFLAFAPVLAREAWPSAARFIPPSLLLLLAALTTFLAIAAWRAEWFVKAFFAETLPPERVAGLQRLLHRQRISAVIGSFVTGVLIAAWVKSLL